MRRAGAGLKPAVAVVPDRPDPVMTATRARVDDHLGQKPGELRGVVHVGRANRAEPVDRQLLGPGRSPVPRRHEPHRSGGHRQKRPGDRSPAYPVEPVDRPTACTLDPDEGSLRLRRWQKLAAQGQEPAHRNCDVLEVRYRREPGVCEELKALVGAERGCCSFVEWRVVLDAGQPVLRISSRPGAPGGVRPFAALFGAA